MEVAMQVSERMVRVASVASNSPGLVIVQVKLKRLFGKADIVVEVPVSLNEIKSDDEILQRAGQILQKYLMAIANDVAEKHLTFS
jgi:hypothetical protein